MGYKRSVGGPDLMLLYFILVSLQIGAGEVYIHHPPKSQRVRAGNTVTFRCLAGSDTLIYGSPDISWRKDHKDIPYLHDHYHVNPVDSSLIIRNVTARDSGIFTCVAMLTREVELDVDKASAKLSVEDVPDPPLNVRLTLCQSRHAQIEWQAGNENNSPLKHYSIQYNTSFDPDTWFHAKTSQKHRLVQRIGLSPWANYSFRVLAENQLGISRPSLPTQKICSMPAEMPHLNPRWVCTSNEKPHKLKISWELLPKTEHNAPGFYYKVKWRRHNVTTQDQPFQEVHLDANTNRMVIDNVPIYTPYEIYVLSNNKEGEAVSTPKMYIGYSSENYPLESPQNFVLDPEKEMTDTTADFMWDEVDTGPWQMQGFFRGYKIQFWKTYTGPTSMREHSIIYREPEPCGPHGSLPHRFETHHRHKRQQVSRGHVYNLWPYTNITAQIVAMNTKYMGPASRKIMFRTKEGDPGPVSKFIVIRKGSTKIELRWEKPKTLNGVLIGYSLAYEVIDAVIKYPKQEFDLNDADINEFKVTDLLPDHLYCFYIWARTGKGRGKVFKMEERTLPEGPPAIPNFTTVNISKRAVNVTWFPTTTGNPGAIFTVYYRKLDGDLRWQTTPKERYRNWTVVEGLLPGVVYEMRVVAKNDDNNGLESSSAIQRVSIGLRRDLTQPTFKVTYVSKTSFGVLLVDYNKDATVFQVQYKPADKIDHWEIRGDFDTSELAMITNLQAGKHYSIRVITFSERGEKAMSLTQTVSAGTDPDAQAAISDVHAPNTAVSTKHFIRNMSINNLLIFSSSVLISYLRLTNTLS